MNYLAAWGENSVAVAPSRWSCKVSSGLYLDGQGISIANGAGQAWTFDGPNYLSVWDSPMSMGGSEGARVSQNGVVLEPNPIVIATAAA